MTETTTPLQPTTVEPTKLQPTTPAQPNAPTAPDSPHVTETPSPAHLLTLTDLTRQFVRRGTPFDAVSHVNLTVDAGEFIASLPIASTDGTLKKRFKDVGPRLRLKTGTLSNVKALAGYWQAPDGRRLALVAIVNSPRALAMGKALDQVVDDVIERFASAAP